MSQKIENAFRKYRNIFLNREEEMKQFLLKYFEKIFNEHLLENLERVDATERIKLAGFHRDLSAWRNYGEITLCSCEIFNGIQKRYDYKFIFAGEILDYKIRERPKESSRVKKEFIEKKEIEESPRVNESFREFTEEEKEQYIKQKEQEKKEIEENFENFLKKQTIKDIIDLIDKSKQIPNFKQGESSHEIEEPQKIELSQEPGIVEQIHGYSIRNYLMVLSQARSRQNNNFIGIINSFWGWKKLGANVLKNPDKSKPYSYKIIVPVMNKQTGALSGFKLGSVFDLSQTNKFEEYLKEREEEEKEIVWKDEIDYENSIEFVKANFANIIINEDFKDGDIRGNYDPEMRVITIHQKNSHIVFHELGKHISLSELKLSEDLKENSTKNEILAEITCYLLMKKFEKVDEYKINYDFGYSNCWALDILDEFKFREFEGIYSKISDYVKAL
ncbi:MAG: hypothetical protein ACFFAN_07325 [Promethearchaeota archaeon]